MRDKTYKQATHRVSVGSKVTCEKPAPPKLWFLGLWAFPLDGWLDKVLNVCETEDSGSCVVPTSLNLLLKLYKITSQL